MGNKVKRIFSCEWKDNHMNKIEIFKLLAEHKLSKEKARELLSQITEVTPGMDSKIGKDSSNIDNKVKEIIYHLLHIDRNEITDSVSLKSLGIDSINGIEIVRDINREFELNIETAAIYDYPVYSEFIAYLSDEVSSTGRISKGSETSKEESKTLVSETTNYMETIKPVKKTAEVDTKNLWVEVCRIIRDYLHLGPEDIDRDSLFKDLGIDSINGVELIREINHNFQTNLETTSIYDYPCVTDFVRFLSEEITRSKELYEQVSSLETTKPYHTVTCESVSKPETIYEESIPTPKLTDQKINLKKVFTEEGTTPVKDVTQKQVSKLTLKVKTNSLEEEHISNKKEEVLPDKKQLKSGAVRQTQDIAIIGISGRYPGADSIDKLWENTSRKMDCMTEIPKDRWDFRAYYSEDAQDIHKTYCTRGGFIENLSEFDSLFFSISPVEADYMDPQHRLVLEETWKTIEDAGYSREGISGKDCAVYIAAAHGDYNSILGQKGLSNNLYSFNGLNVFTISGYISHFFDLHGPNLTIDCACSSSLVAIHEACQSIRHGESELAIAGGVRVMLTPDLLIRTGNLEMLSKSGIHKCYDQEADGMLLSEGVGIVLLKSLEQAKEDGDHIYGVIKGSYVNHNGRSNCISSLSEEAQCELESRAFEKFNINPEDISYLEGNACGSPIGEEIEIKAIKKAFERYTTKKQYCALGSIKAAIGHSTMASGIAGVFHVLMGFKNNRYPTIATLSKENPALKLLDSPFYVSSEDKPWLSEDGKKRLACVSSFGAGGTNCFLILEEGEKAEVREASSREFYLFPLSARVSESLKQKQLDLRNWLMNEKENISLKDISFTLMEGREHFRVRYCYVADSKEALIRAIDRSLKEEKGEKTGDEILIKAAINYETGGSLSWRDLYPVDRKTSRVSLPVYPFLRKKAWRETLNSKPAMKGEVSPVNTWKPLHPFIHSNISTLDKYRYETLFIKDSFYFRDHQINNQRVFPGVAYLEMARAAASLLSGKEIFKLHDIYWTNAMVVEDTLQVYTDITLSGKELYYTVTSITNGQITVHNRGYVALGTPLNTEPAAWLNPREIKDRLRQSITGEDYYRKYANRGLFLGESFQTIKEIYLSDTESLSVVQMDSELGADYVLNPSVMDAMVETVIGLVDNLSSGESVSMPYSLDKLTVYRPLEKEGFVYAKVIDTKDKVKCDVKMTDTLGKLILVMEGLTLMNTEAGVTNPLETDLEEPVIDLEEKKILALLTMLKEKKITVHDAQKAFGGDSYE